MLYCYYKKRFTEDDPDEDPYNHLHFFTALCWLIKLRNYSDDELKLTGVTESPWNMNREPAAGDSARMDGLRMTWDRDQVKAPSSAERAAQSGSTGLLLLAAAESSASLV
jgi:hypothetical protein